VLRTVADPLGGSRVHPTTSDAFPPVSDGTTSDSANSKTLLEKLEAPLSRTLHRSVL